MSKGWCSFSFQSTSLYSLWATTTVLQQVGQGERKTQFEKNSVLFLLCISQENTILLKLYDGKHKQNPNLLKPWHIMLTET